MKGLLERLGYGPGWLELGVVDAEGLARQVAALADDPYPEHHRHRAFRDWLGRREALSGPELAAALALEDTDETDLGVERAIQLARFGGLTDVQLAWLAEQEACTGGPAARVVRRVRVGRALRAGLTDALFREVAESGDGALEQLLLEHPDLTKEQVDWLAEHGSTHRVRNMAAHRVKRR